MEQKTEALALNQDVFSRNTRAQLKQVFDALHDLRTPPDPPKRPIGDDANAPPLLITVAKDPLPSVAGETAFVSS